MILKHRHTCLVVRDIGRAIKFYEDLGFNVQFVTWETWGPQRLHVVKMGTRGTILELIAGDWFNHICFEVSEIPPGPYVHERITDHLHTVFIRDPEGNLIELTKLFAG